MFILENFKGSEILDLAQILDTSRDSKTVGILTHSPEVNSGYWAGAAGM